MMVIRQRLIEGESHDSIQQSLRLNRRTYFRLVRRIWESDRSRLSTQNGEELQNQLSILLERYNFVLQELKGIAQDTTQSAADRMQALHSMASLSLTISKMVEQSPLIVALQSKKLRAIQQGIFTATGLPSLSYSSDYFADPREYIWGGRAKPLLDQYLSSSSYKSSSTRPEQPEQEQEDQQQQEEDDQEPPQANEFDGDN